MNRRRFAAWQLLIALGIWCLVPSVSKAEFRPNILFCISDDQSWLHTGAMGDPVVETPAFDRIAREGILFTHAFCDAPSCGPSRSAILTGQHIWRLEEAANIHSTLPAKFATYTELLQEAGYNVGCTGKAWSPGRLEPGGRTENPAGPKYLGRTLEEKLGHHYIVDLDYAANFEDFMAEHPEGKPFCFWLGTCEPHRNYLKGSGIASGKDPSKVVVPPALPDTDVVRSDILDYYVEIEHYDKMVARAIHSLEKRGLMDNTILVATSDNGMPFPRAKASLYDLGTRMPLAIRWPKKIRSPGRTYDGFVHLSDMAPTFLEAAGLTPPKAMTARSLMDVFTQADAPSRDAAYTAMERHDGCREGGKGYPIRAMRSDDFLYIINFEPGRWPAGDPDKENCARYIPFGEVDPAPTKTFMMESREQYRNLYDLAFAKRPAVELYDIAKDPGQMNNVADDPQYASIKRQLDKQLRDHLIKTKDPRLTGGPVLWDYYPYYGRLKTHEGNTKRKKEWVVDPIPSELAKYLQQIRSRNLHPAGRSKNENWAVDKKPKK